MNRTVFAIVGIAALLLSAQGALGQGNPFPDIDLRTREGIAAADLYRRGVISGFPDGEFKGYQPVNRAQAAKMLLIGAKFPVEEIRNGGRFSDVAESAWYTNYVMTAEKRRIITGHPDGTFRPNDRINTAEFLKMLSLAFGAKLDMPHGYLDVGNEWFRPYAGVAWQNDLFPGRSARLVPAVELSRFNVTVAIFNYLERHPEISQRPIPEPQGTGVGGALYTPGPKAQPSGGSSSSSSSSSSASSLASSSSSNAGPRIIPVIAELWKFTPSSITATEGENVEIELIGISGTHGFRVQGLGIDVTIVPQEVKRFPLPTGKPGTYQFICSVMCGAGHSEMTGWIEILPLGP